MRRGAVFSSLVLSLVGCGSGSDDEPMDAARDVVDEAPVDGSVTDSAFDGPSDAGDTGVVDAAVDAMADGGGSVRLLWSNELEGWEFVHELQIDVRDDVWITGSFFDAITHTDGTVTSRGLSDAFVYGVRSDGVAFRTLDFGGAGPDQGWSVDSDPVGGLLVSGAFYGTADFGVNTLTSLGPSQDGYVMRFDAAGDPQTAFSYGSDYHSGVARVRWAPDGSITAVGGFGGTVDFGGTMRTAAVESAGFIVSSDVDGTARWVRTITPGYVFGVAHDDDGSVYVTGSVTGDADFGGGMTTGGAEPDVFVAAYDAADGAYVWSRRFPPDANGRGLDILVDREGHVSVLGQVYGAVSFGGGASDPGIFLARFRSSDGSLVSDRRFGSEAEEVIPSSLRESRAGILICGQFRGSFTVGEVVFEGRPGRDGFVVELPRSGDVGVGGFVFGGIYDDTCAGAVETTDGVLVVAGTFDGETFAGDLPITAETSGPGTVVFGISRD